MNAQAGWYADPTDASALRWWDGAQWTEHARPAAAAQPIAPVAPVVTIGSEPVVSVAAFSYAASEPAWPASGTTASGTTASGTPAWGTTASAAPEVALDTVAIPTLAPAPVQVHAPSVTAPIVESPGADSHTVQPEPAEAVDRSRPGATRTEPAPSYSSGFAPSPGFESGGGTATLTASRPAVETHMATPFVPSYADAAAESPSRSSFRSPGASGFSAGTAAGFGATAHGSGAVMSASPVYRPTHHWGRVFTVLGVVLVLFAVGGFVGVPRYFDSKAAAAAAQAPQVLVHQAPGKIAGQKRITGPTGQQLASLSSAMTAQGATWAWTAGYGTPRGTTFYLASDVPAAQRAQTYRALTDHGQAQALLSAFISGLSSQNGGAVIGTPSEYASSAGGKDWCMSYTAQGEAGGLCLWTNGREMLAVLSMPGIEETAARYTGAALSQMAALSTRR